VTTTVGQTHRSGSDDAVLYQVPIALSAKASALTQKSLAVMLSEGRMTVPFCDRGSSPSCETTGSIDAEASI